MSIFEGHTFWVAARVPRRTDVSAAIREHGGELTAFEARAEFKIYDHARKDIPQGDNHFSWTLIHEAVGTGVFDDDLIEKHRIIPPHSKRSGKGQPSQVARARTASHGTKGTRSPFTADDDAILAAYVHNQPHQSGNKIYQELEEMYPHHTMHSWRDRWVKHLSRLDERRLRYLISTAPGLPVRPTPDDEQPRRQAPVSPHGSRPPRPSQPPRTSQPSGTTLPCPAPQPVSTSQPAPAPQPARPPQPASHPQPAPTASQARPFTREDDKAIESYVKLKVESGEKWKTARIYKEFSKDHPYHSWESWLNRFRDLWRAEKINTKGWNAGLRGIASSSSPYWSSSHSRAGVRQPQPQPQSQPKPKPQPDPSVEIASTEEAEGREAEESGEEHDKNDVIQPATESMDPLPDDATEEERFYRDVRLWLYMEEVKNGNRIEIRRGNGLQGQEFELWDLSEAVASQIRAEIPPEDIHWGLVAEELGLESVEFYSGLVKSLKECWTKILVPFLAFRSELERSLAEVEYDDDDDDDDDYDDHHEEEEEGEEEKQEEEEGDENFQAGQREPRLFVGQTGQSQGKGGHRDHRVGGRGEMEDGSREFIGVLESEPSTPRQASPSLSDKPTICSPKKRGRVSRATEIPSTPDSVVYGSGSRSAHRGPPAKRHRPLEPETQDFFYTQAMAEDDESDGFDPPPPRQPQLQSLPRSRPSKATSSEPRHREAQESRNSSNVEPQAPRRKSLAFKRRSGTAPQEEAPRGSNHTSQPILWSLAVDSELDGEREPQQESESERTSQSESASASESESESESDAESEEMNESARNARIIRREIRRYKSLGYSGELICNALYRTSLCVGDLALKVMASLKNGRGIPTKIAGVWTPRDDEDLRLVDSVSINMHQPTDKVNEQNERYRATTVLERLERKHGVEGVQLRRDYLAEYEADGAEPPPAS